MFALKKKNNNNNNNKNNAITGLQDKPLKEIQKIKDLLSLTHLQQNQKYGNFRLLFCKGRKIIVQKSAHAYFSSLDQSNSFLVCDLAVAVTVVDLKPNNKIKTLYNFHYRIVMDAPCASLKPCARTPAIICPT